MHAPWQSAQSPRQRAQNLPGSQTERCVAPRASFSSQKGKPYHSSLVQLAESSGIAESTNFDVEQKTGSITARKTAGAGGDDGGAGDEGGEGGEEGGESGEGEKGGGGLGGGISN